MLNQRLALNIPKCVYCVLNHIVLVLVCAHIKTIYLHNWYYNFWHLCAWVSAMNFLTTVAPFKFLLSMSRWESKNLTKYFLLFVVIFESSRWMICVAFELKDKSSKFPLIILFITSSSSFVDIPSMNVWMQWVPAVFFATEQKFCSIIWRMNNLWGTFAISIIKGRLVWRGICGTLWLYW